jgi:hypothetical protein
MGYPLELWPGGPHPAQIAAMQAHQAHMAALARRRRIAFLLLCGQQSSLTSSNGPSTARAGTGNQ